MELRSVANPAHLHAKAAKVQRPPGGKQHQEALLFTRQSIQGAFRYVSDALIAYRKTQEFRQQQQLPG